MYMGGWLHRFLGCAVINFLTSIAVNNPVYALRCLADSGMTSPTAEFIYTIATLRQNGPVS